VGQISTGVDIGQSPHQDYALKDVEIVGDAHARMERREGYRFLSPSKRIETYWRQDGSSVRVIRRRGFGQIALGAEFPDDTIGVFFFEVMAVARAVQVFPFFRTDAVVILLCRTYFHFCAANWQSQRLS
jgi:hypothetical protein